MKFVLIGLAAYLLIAIWVGWEGMKIVLAPGMEEVWHEARRRQELKSGRSLARWTKVDPAAVLFLLGLLWPVMLWPLLKVKASQGGR